MRRMDFLSGLALSPSLASGGSCPALMNVPSGKVVALEGAEAARGWLVPPGSTIKPFSLLALLDAGKLDPKEEFFCPGRLELSGHSLNCSHPYVAVPMNVTRAIAYSCNCAVAHFASRFESGELCRFLERMGFSSAHAVGAGAATQLQALGESGVAVSAIELLTAYRGLAIRAADARLRSIVEGLEGAVEFGTADAAQLNRIRVAGKTGSSMTAWGARVAWFAGFAPSRDAEVAAIVLVQGRSGGADAAPIAHRLLATYFAGRA
jgi:penicillin-binding protein A